MNRILIALVVLLFTACNASEKPIEYGTAECAYCKMTIMDQRYGAELVTDKGKVYTFDAAECLIDYLYYNEDVASNASLLLITPYTHPNQLFDARQATYLISGKMPSPMGAYLTSFSDLETAKEFQASKGGELYNWDEIYKNYKSIRLNAIREFE